MHRKRLGITGKHGDHPSVSHSSGATLCNPTYCSPLGSSVHGILQARILKLSSPWDLPNSGIEPGSPALQGDSLLSEPRKHLESQESTETIQGDVFSLEKELSFWFLFSVQQLRQLCELYKWPLRLENDTVVSGVKGKEVSFILTTSQRLTLQHNRACH